MKPFMYSVSLFCWLAVAACSSSSTFGACDDERLDNAKRVFYDPRGIPSYAGQALVQVSCGNGNFCHSEAAAGLTRHNAPEGTNFDMRTVHGPGASEQATRLLLQGVFTIQENRNTVWRYIETEVMPPSGIGDTVMGTSPRFENEFGHQLPSIRSDDGKELMRDWLACDTPFIERTLPHPNPDYTLAGDLVAARDGEAIPAQWPVIHSRIIVPTCAIVDCHDSTSDEIDLSSLQGAYFNLINVTSQSEECGSMNLQYVVPGEPQNSLLMAKIDGHGEDGTEPPCGDWMPPSDPLLESEIEAIRAWIENGAEP